MSESARNPRRRPEASSSDGAEERKRRRATLETSAGGVVYRLHDGEPLFLLIRDSYKNWGFPKGHLESDEAPHAAAIREVQEETGLADVMLDGEIDTIDWFFRFRGKLVHKVCHFFLMRTEVETTVPQRAEGITACRWAAFDEATQLVSYANARDVLLRANAMVQGIDVNVDPAGAPRRLTPPPSGPARPA
ncbi:MAG: NUDIX hydrolase [Gemmatimonadaceae bacterium]|jgi:8-oxo-dGTP pyrophosphatase MutT (NUDIX family)|uniref:NUDIX hydrolase n=1 Tax=Gemmatimonas sp. TaxID=1962908 RepID=UPI001DF52C8C|nr:NUDIX hydrolase [Gemmatimonas sp.]NCW45680.1 NUDIX hydrolase [Gemmatimonadaceae bacterium]